MESRQQQVLVQNQVEQDPHINHRPEPLSAEEEYEQYIESLQDGNEQYQEELESLEINEPHSGQNFRKYLLKLYIFDNVLKMRSRDIIHNYLNNNTMMILAVGMIPAILLPNFFNFEDHIILAVFEWTNYFVLFIFLVEFILKLYIAESLKKFFNFWNTLDLSILVIAGLEFTPLLLIGSTYSPLLRLLRLVRAFAVAGRLKKRISDERRKYGIPVHVSVYNGKNCKSITSAEQLGMLINDRAKEWIDIQNINFDDINSNSYLQTLSDILHVDKVELKNKITKEIVPGIYQYPDFTLILIKDYKLIKTDSKKKKIKTIDSGITILITKSSLVTISRVPNDLIERTCLDGQGSTINRVDYRIATYMYDILSSKVDDYKEILGQIDQMTDELDIYGELNQANNREKTIKDTFKLKKEVNTVYYNLKRTKIIIEAMCGADITVIPDITRADKDNFTNLTKTVSTLEGNAEDIKENISSMIDWHMNTVSFEMNGIMKALTLITCLTVIPGLVTGFFGENIMGSQEPFNITLLEVFIIVAYLMSWSVIFAYFKGWLK